MQQHDLWNVFISVSTSPYLHHHHTYISVIIPYFREFRGWYANYLTHPVNIPMFMLKSTSRWMKPSLPLNHYFCIKTTYAISDEHLPQTIAPRLEITHYIATLYPFLPGWRIISSRHVHNPQTSCHPASQSRWARKLRESLVICAADN